MHFPCKHVTLPATGPFTHAPSLTAWMERATGTAMERLDGEEMALCSEW
jgi:hypothetical protein